MAVTAPETTPARKARLTVARYRGGAALARSIPRPVGAMLTRGLSRAATRFMPERRFLTERKLRRVYDKPLSDTELTAAVHASFNAYARYWFDSARLNDLDAASIDAGFNTEGYAHIENALATGTAPILALPHLGGWEWGGAWLAQVPRCPVMAVVEPVEPPELLEWMVGIRKNFGLDIVALGPGVASTLVRALRSGQVVCLLADRQVGAGGEQVEFFGEQTLLPGGPATLALRTGAALLPTAVYHEGSRYRGKVLPPISVERRDGMRADVARITQELAYALESLIREAPEQWHLMQPNWPSDRDALQRFRG